MAGQGERSALGQGARRTRDVLTRMKKGSSEVPHAVKLSHAHRFFFRPVKPYHVERTLRKPGGWSLFTPLEVYEDGVLWTAAHVQGHLAGFRLRAAGRPKGDVLLADVFFRRGAAPGRDAVRAWLERKLAVRQDLGLFYRMAVKDPVLSLAVRDLRGMHDTGSGSLFGEAALAILLQMAPLKRSEEMMRCVIRNYGDPARFDKKEVYAWPRAERIAVLRPSSIGRRCRLGYRAKNLVSLARALGRGFPSLEELEELPLEEARARLMELPGIGGYSADIIMGGFPIDAWSAEVFSVLFFGEEDLRGREAVEKVRAEGERRWGRWAWMAFLYVVHDLENLSRELGVSLRLQ
jgi:3-methyladenine DNA glycosylase/8-oxoguanine DNA glycosylase